MLALSTHAALYIAAHAALCCALSTPYYAVHCLLMYRQLLFWMILPVALVGVILVGAVVILLRKGRCSCTGLVITALPSMLKACFFLSNHREQGV